MAGEATGWEAAYRKRPSRETEPHPDAPGLEKLFKENGVRRILDLGCGGGRHLVYFAALGYLVTGTDSAPTALAQSRVWLEKENLSSDLFVADMSELPLRDTGFDAVICIKTINHQYLEGVCRTISEIHRVLKPGGLVFVTSPTNRPECPEVMTGKGWIEAAEHTYIAGSGHEKDVLHYFMIEEDIPGLFSQFEILDMHGGMKNASCITARKPE